MLEWVSKQNSLLDFEHEEESLQLATKISTLSAQECQACGISLLNLEFDEIRTSLFGRCTISVQLTNKNLLPRHTFKVGDEIRLRNPKFASSEDAIHAILEGVVTAIYPKKIEITCEEPPDESYFSDPLRLDMRSNDYTYKKMKSALTDVSESDNPIVRILFDPSASVTVHKSESIEPHLINTQLNSSQVLAIQCALDASHICVIHGPPGTGKTATITELIIQAIRLGQKILVCAGSNVAVDNVLERVASSPRPAKAKVIPPRIVRLGHPARVSSCILSHCLDALISEDEGTEIISDIKKELDSIRSSMAKYLRKKDFAKLREIRSEMKSLRKEVRRREERVVQDIIRSRNVVMCTCVGAGNKLLRDVEFDMVIIDEAAQSLEAACWIPLLRGRKCVLAGDHLQLPPTVKSSAAMKGGLDVTLFERIIQNSVKFGSVSRLLDIQYRMNNVICEWASMQMYEGKLKSHDSVANHTLADLIVPISRDGEPELVIEHVPVMVLLDTSGCGMPEVNCSSGSHRNEHEALVVKRHVDFLLSQGIRSNQIGVITPYNGQLEVLKQTFFQDELDEDLREGLEIRTVDGFQGGEKECIIISLVRSNDRHEVGFLGDPRRINVAVTRAKRHLCVICDVTTCSNDEFIGRLLSHMSSKGDHRCVLEYMDADDSEIWNSDSADAGTSESTGAVLSGVGDSMDVVSSVFVNTREIEAKKNRDKKAKGAGRSKLGTSSQPPSTSLLASESIGHSVPQRGFTNFRFDSEITRIVHQFREGSVQCGEVLRANTSLVVVATKNSVLKFPPNFNSYERKLVHDLAEELGLHHRSVGLEPLRFVEISKVSFDQAVVHVQSPAAEHSVDLKVVDVEDDLICDSSSEITEEIECLEDKKKSPLKSAKAQKKKKASKVISSDVRGAGGGSSVTASNGLKYYVSEERKNAMNAAAKSIASVKVDDFEDEMAAVEALISANQTYGNMTKLRISSVPMPNHDKEQSQAKLRQQIEAARVSRSSSKVDATSNVEKSKPRGKVLSKPTSASKLGKLPYSIRKVSEDPRLRPFLNSHFDPQTYIKGVIREERSEECSREVSACIDDVNEEIKGYISLHRDTLMSGMQDVALLAERYNNLSSNASRMRKNLDRLKRDALDTHDLVKLRTCELERIHFTNITLRQLRLFVHAKAQLDHHLRLSSEEAAKAGRQSTFVDPRFLASTAKALNELEGLLECPILAGIELVIDHAPGIRSFGEELRKQAQERLLSSMTERNQAAVAATLQVFYNLRSIPEVLILAIDETVARTVQLSKEVLNIKDLVQANPELSSYMSVENGDRTTGSSKKFSISTATRLAIRDLFQSWTQAVVDQASLIYSLQKIFARKEDPSTHRPFIEILAELPDSTGNSLLKKGQLLQMFWQRFSVSFQAVSSDLLRNYPTITVLLYPFLRKSATEILRNMQNVIERDRLIESGYSVLPSNSYSSNANKVRAQPAISIDNGFGSATWTQGDLFASLGMGIRKGGIFSRSSGFGHNPAGRDTDSSTVLAEFNSEALLVGSLGVIRDRFLMASFSRMCFPINQMFPEMDGYTAAIPSKRDIQALIKVMLGEIVAAAVDGEVGLLSSVCKESLKAIELVLSKVEGIISVVPETKKIVTSASPRNGPQEHNAQLVVLLSGLQECLEKVPDQAVKAILDFPSNPYSNSQDVEGVAGQSSTIQYLRSELQLAVDDGINRINILAAVHLLTPLVEMLHGHIKPMMLLMLKEGTSAQIVAAPTLSLADDGSDCSKPVQSILRALNEGVKVHLSSLPRTSFVISAEEELALRVMSTFISAAALIRPVNEQSKLRVAKDMAALEQCLANCLSPIRSPSTCPVTQEFRAFRRLLFIEEDLMPHSSLPRGEADLDIVLFCNKYREMSFTSQLRPSTLLGFLSSCAPKQLPAPFDCGLSGVSLQSYFEDVTSISNGIECSDITPNSVRNAYSRNYRNVASELASWENIKAALDIFVQRVGVSDQQQRTQMRAWYEGLLSIGGAFFGI